jgi:hypothetical protein
MPGSTARLDAAPGLETSAAGDPETADVGSTGGDAECPVVTVGAGSACAARDVRSCLVSASCFVERLASHDRAPSSSATKTAEVLSHATLRDRPLRPATRTVVAFR